jgi:predicted nucleic acid-binding Zn ribbon protein
MVSKNSNYYTKIVRRKKCPYCKDEIPQAWTFCEKEECKIQKRKILYLARRKRSHANVDRLRK